MATVLWVGNQRPRAQAEKIQVTAAGVGGTLAATVNQKSVTYACVSGDTTATAATNFYAALADAQDDVLEMAELTFANPSDGVVTATASTAGTPFTLTSAGALGATLTQTQTAANLSPGDVGDAQNWRRNGVAALPQDGDDGVLRDSDISLLWNLSALAAVRFATFTRWASFTGQVGLSPQNPAGYLEYRPTYFRLSGPAAGTLLLRLGVGDGQGPGLERYDAQAQKTQLEVLQGGEVYFLGTNAANTVSLTAAALGVAVATGEVATILSGEVDGGGELFLGEGVTWPGELLSTGGGLTLYAAPGSVVARSSQIALMRTALTWPSLLCEGGTAVACRAGGTITLLHLKSGSTLDKSGDLRPLTVVNATLEGDSCQVLDPLDVITWTNPVNVTTPVTSGPFTFTGPRTVLIS